MGAFLGVSFMGWFICIAVWLHRTLPKIRPQAPTVIRVTEEHDDISTRVVEALAALALSRGLPEFPLPRDWIVVSAAVTQAVLGPDLAAMLADGELS